MYLSGSLQCPSRPIIVPTNSFFKHLKTQKMMKRKPKHLLAFCLILPMCLVSILGQTQSVSMGGFVKEETITISDGDVTVSLEEYPADGPHGSGAMRKILVGMKIPYAAPPVEQLRFKPPQPPQPWSKPMMANRWANMSLNRCPQYDAAFGSMQKRRKRATMDDVNTFWLEFVGGIGEITATEMSEDCLTLNVWAPTQDDGSVFPAGNMSVMVFVHGGGFTIGSANANLYEGTSLSMATNSVIVTFNYRLGALGFFKSSASEPTANVGLMDQAAVLSWVQSNIGSFGGDKDRVTLFGESAGSASVNMLMMSPMANDNFHRVILQSGVVTNVWAYAEPDKAEMVSLYLAQSVGCADISAQRVDDTIVACMRGQDAMNLINQAKALEGKNINFSPTSDDEFFPFATVEEALNQEASKKDAADVIIGFNRDEGSLWLALSGMAQFGPGAEAGKRLSKAVFDGFVKDTIPEAKLPFVMDRIRDQFFTGINKDLIELLSDQFFSCKIAQMAAKLSMNRKVYTYIWDVRLGFVEKAYPYMGAGHALELPVLFGRPFINPGLYSDEEREVAGHMMHYWGIFANGSYEMTGGPFYQDIPSGNAFVIEEGKKYRQENIKMDRCFFLDCLPSLAELAKTGSMKDMTCMIFAQANMAGTIVVHLSSIILTLFTLLFFVAQRQ